jgi:putative transposase
MSSPRLVKGRRSEIGHYYAITTCAFARSPLFSDPIAARCVIAELNSADYKDMVITIAWVVMPNHLHWLFRVEKDTLSGIVQKMKCSSANRINAALHRHGAVWQAGFFDHRIRTENDLELQARYIIENPVRAGIVASIEEYPHSGGVGFR